ncbi:MAG TPA: TonB-dependent receptor [Thermoanaerobaculia bacterium]|nr:TonB-dependent receptor [Thermoanaerobaculia bacterium]
MQRKRMKVLDRLSIAAAVAAALLLAVLAGAPRAAAQSAGGTVGGKVVDKSGAGLPGVTVTASQKGTGYERTTVTAGDGSFTLPSLPVGIYAVKADLSGFGSVNVDDVHVDVASSRKLEITLTQSAVQESITVVDEAPLIQNTPSIGTVVSQQELDTLPLNGRQFANLAVLAPGTTLGYNSDPTKPGQLVVELNGGIGRNVNFTVDGGDNTDDTIGGALQNYSVEDVQEFKIQTMQYKAEFGRSTGGVLSVVTKSGTNQFTGSGFGYFRRTSLDSKTETEILSDSPKQKLSRDQYGGSLGGPIVPDKLHFFGTYEKTTRDTFYTVNSGGSLPAFDGKSFATPFSDQLASGKLTWDATPKNYLQVRFGYQKNTDKYGAGPLAAPDSLGTITNEYKSFLFGYSAQIGADMLNELLFQYSKFANAITADSNAPAIYFPNGATLGQNINTPQTTNQIKYQYKDDFSFSQNLGGQRHDFKTGAAFINEPTLGGSFTTGTSGQYTHATNDPNSPITDITIFGGFAGQSTPMKEYSVYAQDDWAAASRLTLNIGLRYDYWSGFNLNQRSNPIWQELSTQTKYQWGYLDPFRNGGGGQLSNDSKDIAPRLGLTWDVAGDGKQLLRAGYGIYYDFPYTNATILFPATAVQSNYGVVYNNHNGGGIRNPDGSFFQPGQPLPPNQLPGAAVPPPNEVASPNLKTPRSGQGSLGYSWQATPWLGLNVEGVAINYTQIPYRFRANLFDPATGKREFPDFGNFRLWEGNGRAHYDGLNLGFHVRVPEQHLTLQGFYTLSTAKGTILAGADEFRLTDLGFQPDLHVARDVSVNPTNPTCSFCAGPLNTDARHRFTLGATWLAPWGIDLAGMFRYRSAFPIFIHGDGLPEADLPATNTPSANFGFNINLPPGVSVNSGRGASFEQFDFNVSKEIGLYKSVKIVLIAQVFNVFNAKNSAGFDGLLYTHVLTTRPDGSQFLKLTPNPTFGQPTIFAGDSLQGEQRLVQLGARLTF